MTEITDEMVERAIADYEFRCRERLPGANVRSMLESALNPPAEPEITVSEGMKEAGGISMQAALVENPGKWWGYNNCQFIYRAMERQRIKENGPRGAACAATYLRKICDFGSLRTPNTRSGRGRRKDDK